MTDDHIFVDASGGRFVTRETMRAGWRTISDDSGYKVSHEEILAKGDTVAVFGSARGTFSEGKLKKENSGKFPPHGKP